MYYSEIRDSEKKALLEKVRNKKYGQYLYSINLSNLRQFKNQKITFDFPVTALVAPNGGGKTTVLGAAALAYKEVKPGLFFSKSGKFDNSMANWKIEYELVDKKVSSIKSDSIRRSAAFKDLKWKRDKFLSRKVIVMGVARTVPAVERTELKKCATNKFTVSPTQISTFDIAVLEAVEKILGKSVAGYQRIQVDSKGKVSLLTGLSDSGTAFSEFHFGAGESSIIRLIMQVEAAEENSLVLIEEIENGLHPIASVRLVEYLIEAASRLKIQTIFTTHSDYALLPLPGEAIWASLNGKLTQGRLKISSLRELRHTQETRLIIYTEDEFTKLWVESMLRYYGADMQSIEVHYIGGDGNAVQINKFNNQNPGRKAPSVCIIDGDSLQIESEIEKVFRLPGLYPEAHVYDSIYDAFSEISPMLCIALGWDTIKQSELKRQMEGVRTTNRDYHLLFNQLGMKLSLISEETVRTAFLNVWCHHFREELNKTLNPIKYLLPITETV
ncbi:AAA family ATPase [Brevibacillus brevis]|uniref:ATP-dependent nuclease n=1 Tax=Brevibacillus brevis TaxID=1393 RepID=UPI001F3361AC|nr:ATP-binding protein [Brevibacillus brevis]UIO40670.1 AAA family ATPase [Brevibacillus brevis]